MSMMFDALQALDASAGAPAASPRAAVRDRTRPRRWLLLATGGGILLTGSLLWAATRPATTAAPTPVRAQPTPIAGTVALPPAAAPKAPVNPAPAPAVARTAASATPAPKAMPARPPAFTAVSAPVPVSAPAALPSAPAAALAAEISVRDASASDTPAEGQAVARLVAAINTSVHAGDFGGAEQSLAKLEAELPPRSLTLLRMQAWVAHTRGDAAGALALYRKIAERVPGDQTVAINLAILEADNGQPDSARARLQQLRTDNVDSVALERAIQQVEARLR